MTADVIDIGRAYQVLRSPDREVQRQRDLAVRRVAAFNRALSCATGQGGTYSPADLAMFGPIDAMLALGPGTDPRLRASGPSAA